MAQHNDSGVWKGTAPLKREDILVSAMPSYPSIVSFLQLNIRSGPVGTVTFDSQWG